MQLVAYRAGHVDRVGHITLRCCLGAEPGEEAEERRAEDYMDPLAVARLLGRTSDLVAAPAAP